MKLPREALKRLIKKFKAAIDGIIVGLKPIAAFVFNG
jgi:hypothetical protein